METGSAMKKSRHRGDSTLFDTLRQCLTRIIERKIFSESKNEYLLVTFGSELTVNHLASELGGYKHITIHNELKLPSFELMKEIEELQVTEHQANSMRIFIEI